jgi:succinate dehydrogenase/fumarate reductase flavoprotein subunit
MTIKSLLIDKKRIPCYTVNTLVIGTGAASLNCAEHLYRNGMADILIVTEKIGGGTSKNTGSDKQTFYKTSVFGKEGDSPYSMAEALFGGGAMHGDIALIEAITSAQEFFHLGLLGVQFPHNRLGGYVGYKTDHDPKQRATSAGPWTSSQMVECLLKEVQAHKIPILDNMDIIALLTDTVDGKKRAVGAIGLDKKKLTTPTRGLTLFNAENVVFGCGGPGGIYKTSVYPTVHTGAIGLALEVGAKAQNLTESQYGLASIKFRWNVSGTYQQVIPRYISTAQDGSDEKEFLNPYFPDMSTLATDVFLKGYQWPFDPRKIENYGSSLVDVLVYIETMVKGRRVYMDFRKNPQGGDGLPAFMFDMLKPEAYEYLKKSNALFGSPIQRLAHMNQMSIDLYKKHGIDLLKEPLEVAVCAQHNNGGLTGDIWWESENISHLFPIGEVNGSHGVYRPGGSALNSGQCAGYRAAQRIANRYAKSTYAAGKFTKVASQSIQEQLRFMTALLAKKGKSDQKQVRDDFQTRMTQYGAHIRDAKTIDQAIQAAAALWDKVKLGTAIRDPKELSLAYQNRHLCLAHLVYLEAIREYLKKGGGSRGSYMVMDPHGTKVLDKLGDQWRFKQKDPKHDEQVQETIYNAKTGTVAHQWVARRPIPPDDSWFENVWGDYVKKKVFD